MSPYWWVLKQVGRAATQQGVRWILALSTWRQEGCAHPSWLVPCRHGTLLSMFAILFGHEAAGVFSTEPRAGVVLIPKWGCWSPPELPLCALCTAEKPGLIVTNLGWGARNMELLGEVCHRAEQRQAKGHGAWPRLAHKGLLTCHQGPDINMSSFSVSAHSCPAKAGRWLEPSTSLKCCALCCTSIWLCRSCTVLGCQPAGMSSLQGPSTSAARTRVCSCPWGTSWCLHT